MRAPASFDVVEYATISAELAEPSCDRARVLAAHDLDEEAWSEIDGACQEALTRAMESDADGAPPLVVAYADAFAQARARLNEGKGVISIERFADATREIQLRGDALAALSRLGLTLDEFLRANEHWTRRMMSDPELFARYKSRLR